MGFFAWIMIGVAVGASLVNAYLLIGRVDALREKEEEIKHLTTRVDSLMECVRDFNKKLKDSGIR